jgi:flagellar biosynthetic protein FliP
VRRFLFILALLSASLLQVRPLAAQEAIDASAPVSDVAELGPSLIGESLAEPGADEQPAPEGQRFSTAIEIALLLTLLSLLPAALISVTCFTRIVIVLSFVRRSLSVNELPPNPIIIGLSLFLTSFVMAPVATRMYHEAYVPYKAQEIAGDVALQTAWGDLRTFLLANTRQGELELFADLAKFEPADGGTDVKAEELPFQVVVPAFVLSELKTAFQMGFLLFLPFLVIDLVIASVLISMGMFMLPPVMISTPFKILLFILVDGWHLVCESLVTSFVS